jgi:hypothetical protein
LLKEMGLSTRSNNANTSASQKLKLNIRDLKNSECLMEKRSPSSR